eukprot:SAG11_NODE_684_length_7743_cov_53.800628_5_plen_203_part_00
MGGGPLLVVDREWDHDLRECDAKCAVVLSSFYPRCQRFLASQFSIADMAGYDKLYSTCTRALPAEPLLRALVVCSANPLDPCFEVDCGKHGSCGGGTCQCEHGYSEGSCDAFDPCAGLTVGSMETVMAGCVSVCEQGYSGESCADEARCAPPTRHVCLSDNGIADDDCCARNPSCAMGDTMRLRQKASRTHMTDLHAQCGAP